MTDSSLDITLICIAASHPEDVKRLILSVRAFYPDMPIIVGSQNKTSEMLAGFLDEQKVICPKLDPDCGMARARNVCISRADTEFVLFCDGSCIFTEKTDLHNPVKAFQVYSELGVITGRIINRVESHGYLIHEKICSEKNLYLDKKNRVLISIPISYTNPKPVNVNNRIYYKCDIGSEFALIRKAVFSGPLCWDERFKYNGWHEDFYLNLKYNSYWEIACSPDFSCQRQQNNDVNGATLCDRQAEWSVFSRKWNVDEHLDIGAGLRMFDTYLDPDCEKQDLIQSPAFLPPYKDSYLRILANGECLASDVAPDILYGGKNSLHYNAPAKWAEIEKAYQKYGQDKATFIWKIARPFMKLEQSLRKRVRRLKLHG